MQPDAALDAARSTSQPLFPSSGWPINDGLGWNHFLTFLILGNIHAAMEWRRYVLCGELLQSNSEERPIGNVQKPKLDSKNRSFLVWKKRSARQNGAACAPFWRAFLLFAGPQTRSKHRKPATATPETDQSQIKNPTINCVHILSYQYWPAPPPSVTATMICSHAGWRRFSLCRAAMLTNMTFSFPV